MLDAPSEPIVPAFDAAAPALSPFALPPVAPDDPCGPDLDLEGDADFLRFVAETEGLLPAKPENYYEFKRESVDFRAAFGQADKLLKRTLDARILVLLAKLSLLNRDLRGFARFIGNLAWALGGHWEDVHPRAENGDYSLRLSQLETLEDNASVLLPLQYAALVESQREGALCYRDHLVASGAAQPRSVTRLSVTGEQETTADEKLMPAKTIERLLRNVEIEKLVLAFETVRGLLASFQSIRTTTTESLGVERSPQLPKLEKLVAGMAEFLRAALVARDPTLAPAKEDEEIAADGAAAGAAEPTPTFASRAEVDAALASAFGYFAASEPTSPALLLIRQARETLGKNLYEVMQLLAPPHADAARVFVGPDGAFTVPVKSLANAPTVGLEPAQPEPASSRGAALALIDAVAQHMQRAEPSSPVPYLLDRAKSLASRDFLSLLADVLPEDAIEALKRGR
ncbi:MAG: type VI secretion system ImpA family N-terminal domain-containing protein [Hyphomicrobiales bacterium]|nr:type VI secretion system ImpA family N-terminal domain-containing protein [Hyphomicrobiales bacterium]